MSMKKRITGLYTTAITTPSTPPRRTPLQGDQWLLPWSHAVVSLLRANQRDAADLIETLKPQTVAEMRACFLTTRIKTLPTGEKRLCAIFPDGPNRAILI